MVSRTYQRVGKALAWVLLVLLAGWMMLEPAIHTVSAQQGDTGGKKAEQELEIFSQLSSGNRVKAERQYTTPEQPTVYLTFDDGPSKHTGAVLDILKQEGIQGTFFVLGQLVSNQKELVSRMQKEGHAIGNHSYNHVYKELYRDFASFWDQVDRTDRALEEILGYKPNLLRAPGGTYTNFDAFYYYYLEAAGFHIVDWNVDSRDAIRKGVTAGEIVAEIRKSALKHELVVLLHDGAGHEETVKALPDIISYYKEKGYAFASLGEEVQPVQFPVGQVKWARSYSYSSFANASQGAFASGIKRNADRVNALQLAGQELIEGKQENLAPQTPPLVIQTDGGEEWVLQQEQYSFSHSRFSVPLRKLAEELGGAVAWDQEQRLAVIHVGAITIVVDPVAKTVRQQRLGQPSVTHWLADISFSDGEIRIPLRAGAQLMGGAVTGYTLNDGDWSVSLAVHKDRQMPAVFHSLSTWTFPDSLNSHV